tara:strand:+ start:453 stop:917 length:465 start_codon:yes stop_codon:yes gene_type:complete
MHRIRLAALLSVALLFVFAMQPAFAQQGFRGGDPGDLQQQFQVPPRTNLYNQDQEITCISVRDVQSTGTRTCTYQCEDGSFYDREQSRSNFCERSIAVTLGEIQRQASGQPLERCQLKRLRLTRTDKICIYNCDGETVTQSIPSTRTCDRDLRR